MVWEILAVFSLVTITDMHFWVTTNNGCAFIFTAAGNGTRCFECTDVPHPADCTRVTECLQGQMCVVKQFITSGGLLLYNSGCESAQRCTSQKREMSLNKSRSRRKDISTCWQCCQNDFCNDEGCGNKAFKQPQRGPLCFACDYANTPKQCRKIAKCHIGQVCMLTEVPPIVPTGYTLYHSTCQRSLDCTQFQIIGRKRNNYCHVCCKDDFCNDNCGNSITTVAMTTTGTTTTVATSATKITARSTTAATTPLTTTKMRTHPTIQTSTTSKDYCTNHSGYRFDKNTRLCFKVHYTKRSWTQAAGICKHEGGTLAIIDTKAKWEYLRSKLQEDHNHHGSVYIGGRNSDHHRDVFLWPTGHMTTFTAWAKHEPDKNSEACIRLEDDQHYAWHDTPCSENYAFVCSINK